jgi:hypothetical protein
LAKLSDDIIFSLFAHSGDASSRRPDLGYPNDFHAQLAVRLWSISNGALASNVFLGAPPLEWQVAGAGDFNGDGHADILWRDTSGDLAIWLNGDINAATYPSYRSAGGPVDLSWSIRGIGDFNADGTSDILWVHTNGSVALWFMSGGQFSADV